MLTTIGPRSICPPSRIWSSAFRNADCMRRTSITFATMVSSKCQVYGESKPALAPNRSNGFSRSGRTRFSFAPVQWSYRCASCAISASAFPRASSTGRIRIYGFALQNAGPSAIWHNHWSATGSAYRTRWRTRSRTTSCPLTSAWRRDIAATPFHNAIAKAWHEYWA